MIYVALIFFIIAPVLSLPFSVIGLFKDEKHKKLFMLLIAFVMGIISFYISHNQYNIDLNVYEVQVEALSKLPFNYFIEFMLEGKEYLTQIIFWILGKLDYFDFWKFLVAFLGYSIVGITVIEYGKKNKFSNNMMNLSLIVVWLLYNKLNLLLGVRNELAFCIFVYAIYLDIIKESKNKILIYILYTLPVLIHQSTLILIILRLFLPIFMKSRIPFYLVLALYAFSYNFVTIFAGVLVKIPMFGNIFSQLSAYGESIESAIGSNVFITVILICSIILYCILLKSKKKVLKDENLINKKIYSIAEMLLAFGIFSFNYYHVFIRYTNFSMVFVAMILIFILNKYKIKEKTNLLLITIFIIVIILGFLQYKEIMKYDFISGAINNLYKNIFFILGGK